MKESVQFPLKHFSNISSWNVTNPHGKSCSK